MALAAICGIVLFASIIITSPIWGSAYPEDIPEASVEKQSYEGIEGVFDERDKLLAVLAATCTILAIIVPSHAMPKTYATNAVTGSLSAFAAVVGTFNLPSLWTPVAILLVAAPILIATTTAWRLPRSSWECALWVAIVSIVTLIMVAIAINTKIGLSLASILGLELVRVILATIVGVAGTILLSVWFTLVVKAIGMGQRDYNWNRRRR